MAREDNHTFDKPTKCIFHGELSGGSGCKLINGESETWALKARSQIDPERCARPCSGKLKRRATSTLAEVSSAMKNGKAHVVLLGDSIFDNAAYVPGDPDVIQQVQSVLQPSGSASLLAVDGAVTSGVARQLNQIPADATQLVVSVGGNDALGESHILSQHCDSVAAAVDLLAAAQRRFATDYDAMLKTVLATGLPTAICTIYDANHAPPQGRIIRAALSLFNDVITRAAFSRGLPLIDLRLICNEPADYANPIEPSARGGEKIARAIAALLAVQRSDRSVVIV